MDDQELESMNIVIFGGTGRTGRELVDQALGEGHQVTVFARDKTRVRFAPHRDLTVVEGKLTSVADVRAAVKGQNAVVSTLGVGKVLRHDPEVIEGISIITRVMKEENVSRMVYLSVFLAGGKPWQFSFFVRNILRRMIRQEVSDHEVKEALVRNPAGAYTIVRAARLTNGPLTAKYRHGESIPMGMFLPSVSRADVAHFMLEQIVRPYYVNRTVLVGG